MSMTMHELALMEDLVAFVSAEVGEERVLTLRLQVGKNSCVAPDALRFCFDVCAHGTALEGARLDIIQSAGTELRLEEVEVACVQSLRMRSDGA